MKKLLLLFLIVPAFCLAQKNGIEPEDLIQEFFTDVKIYLPNADKELKPINIKLTATQKDLQNTGVDYKKINNMILTGYYNAMYACKNKFTFVCKEITVFYSLDYKL